VTAPTPSIPYFTDGTILHQADLNALSSNLSTLYTQKAGGFYTQAPMCVVHSTSSQSIPRVTDTLVNFGASDVLTRPSMWTGSTPYVITAPTAGVYWLFGQLRWPLVGSPAFSNVCTATILVNATSTAGAVATQILPFVGTNSAGTTCQVGALRYLSAGSNVYLNAWHSDAGSQSLNIDFGGSFLGMIYLSS